MRIFLFGWLLLLTTPVWASAKIEHWQTAQGSRVYFIHTEDLPLVDIQVVFDAGSARDGEQYGVAALTAGLLDTGADKLNADAIAQSFDSVGAEFSTGSATDTATVALRSLTEPALLQKALTTMQAVITKPTFNPADFEREKKRTLAGLTQQQESPGDIANIAFSQALYGAHPYAHPDSGTLETVNKLTRDDVKRFYQRYYVASNAMVVIVGHLTQQQAADTAEQLLKGLAPGQKPEAIPDVMMPKSASTKHIPFPSTQTHVLIGLPGSYRKDPDYFNLYVGNHILGGGDLVSRLFSEVREKRGLAYSAASAFIPMLKPGPFLVSLQTRNDQAQQALDVARKTLADFIAQGPTEDEVNAAKKNIIGGFAMRFDTNKKLASYLSMIGFYQMPLDYLDTFKQQIEQVNAASIRDAFARRVKQDLLQTVTVGNAQ
ncbi:M16 family metallopeptidase [Methylocucumis oryzae]|uniref:Zinc protease n=1 Tax=Methylocucumis oryzae TaxID=1632867 RepID=A0A0F3IHS7_9GAMM|nr:pitrilysin family protein [Methylocucumis oryzae]KJV06232.1 zinc protease [Methylocucumis oryzae]